MRIVVTGASGNVGTALLRLLRHEPGWSVTGVARRPPDRGQEPYDRAGWVACDLGGPVAPDVLPGVLDGADAVVHLAWAIHPRRGDPPMRRTNVVGTRNLLRAAGEAGVPHVVVASSVAAYSPPPRWSRVTEGWRRDGVPQSAYSRGKAWLERELDEFEQRTPTTVTARIRPCAILQHDAAGQFAGWLLSTLLPGHAVGRPWLPLPLWPRLRGQLVHSADVADALRLILARRAAGAFNLAAEPVLTAADVAAGLGGPRLPVPRRVATALAWLTWRAGLQPVHPGWLALADQAALVDTTKARAELGWEPAHSAHETLAEFTTGLRAGAGTGSAPLAPPPSGVPERLQAVPWGRPSHQSQA
ncbi:nucleoside-diphosphate sugar epimerase [Prauserella coralliicola]|nr:nucleoside-diphosphate sugar epimerase [Prauserella coralliicola]